MNNLGHYYQFIDYNYNLMIKYYLMAIKKGNSDSLKSLVLYYEYCEINYNLMKKYYLLYYHKYFDEKYYITNERNMKTMYMTYKIYKYNHL